MALDTGKVKLPTSITTYIKDNAKGSSTIAALCPAVPQIFTNSDYLVFSGASEAEVVEEGKPKGSYEQTLTPLSGKRFKVVTTTRVTNELEWADDDNKLQIVEAIQADQVAALGRALDYVVYHGINPKAGTVMDGYSPLAAAAQQVAASGDRVADIDALADKLMNYDISGMALSKQLVSDLRKLRMPATGMRLYPEIPLSMQPGSLEGIPAATSATVNGSIAKVPTKVEAIMGDYSKLRWGFVRDMWAEVIPYGDPDGQGDLKNTNQVAYRTEAVYAYTVLDPQAFAVLKSA